MAFIGKYTFELYLTHVFLFEYIFVKYPIPTNYGTELLAIAISCVMAFVLHILTGVFSRGLRKLTDEFKKTHEDYHMSGTQRFSISKMDSKRGGQ